jgi:hypothetical protein
MDMLRSIFQKSTHIDVRVAILGYLLETLQTTVDSNMLTAIEEVVPVTAPFDERKGPTTEDARYKLIDNELPDISTVMDVQCTPLLVIFINHLAVLKGAPRIHSIDQKFVLLLELSIQNQRRWMQAFGRSNSFERVDIPPMPIQPGILRKCAFDTSISAHIAGVCLLRSFTTYASVQINASSKVKAVLNYLKSPALAKSYSGKYMLSLLDCRSASGTLPAGTSDLVALLARPWKENRHDAIKLGNIRKCVWEIARALINNCDDTLTL